MSCFPLFRFRQPGSRPGAPVAVNSPLIANLTVTKTCLPARLHETVTFTSITSGGMEPYRTLWDLFDPAGYSIVSRSLTSAEVKVNFNLAIDDLPVTLMATDARAVTPRVDSETKLVDILTCCNLQITTPAVDRTVECDSGGNIPEFSGWLAKHGGVVAVDLGGGEVTWSDNTAMGVCPVTVTRTYSLIDECGNTTQVNHSLSVEDKTPPEVTITSHCVFLGRTGQWTLNESDFRLLTAGIQDNCIPDEELVLLPR